MPDLILRRARVWTSPDETISGPQDVLILAGRVAAIGAVASSPGIAELDLGGRVVTSGFWNCHVHLTGRVWSRASRAPAEVQDSLDDMLLRRGFVGAVDLGSLPAPRTL
ncbi:dihydroorotase [Clavibacter michiganensis subsp. michiganensis]|uniref:Dihydroorotase n=1 Tax=Clavibacter michiganensis subsp. michiganensis TaxID=33013 RepID=A0A251XNQ6_CLAMM|nr:dihydroorotase [Clavibacter michiganensis subsp. michiganensis]OUE05066.1 dihydroorotase [Clavibacter michiganensis subsp. michiganensis]